MTSIAVARLTALGEPLEIGLAEKPTPGPREILVKVAACGLVPNSSNVVSGKTPFTLPTLPTIFGLDVSGVIAAVGEQELNLKVGDRVYVDPLLACGSCLSCRRGEGCEHAGLRGYMSTSPGEKAEALLNQNTYGGLSEYVVAPNDRVHVLPDSIDERTAARFGYIGTSYAGLKDGELGPGKTLLINGVTGTLGVAAVAIALGFGATKILGIGRNKERLEQVAQLAPTRIEVVSSEDESDLAAWVVEHTDGVGVDVFYDCLGVGGDATTTNDLIRAVRPGGKAMLAAGGAEGTISRSYEEAMSASVAVVGSGWATSAMFVEMIDLIDAGVIDLSFYEHRAFSLDEVNDAFAFVGDRPGGFINVLVEPARRT